MAYATNRDEAKIRVVLKRGLRKAGVPFHPEDSTEALAALDEMRSAKGPAPLCPNCSGETERGANPGHFACLFCGYAFQA